LKDFNAHLVHCFFSLRTDLVLPVFYFKLNLKAGSWFNRFVSRRVTFIVCFLWWAFAKFERFDMKP